MAAFFSDIIGHEGPIRALELAIDSGRVPHTYLFAGPEGTVIQSELGKSTLGEEEVEHCLLEVVTGLKYIPPEGGGIASVGIPFLIGT